MKTRMNDQWIQLTAYQIQPDIAKGHLGVCLYEGAPDSCARIRRIERYGFPVLARVGERSPKRRRYQMS